MTMTLTFTAAVLLDLVQLKLHIDNGKHAEMLVHSTNIVIHFY